MRKELVEYIELELAPNFWNDQSKAQKISKAKARIANALNNYDQMQQRFDYILELISLNDESLEEEILTELTNLQKIVYKLEIECLFSGENDANNCFIDINSGAGGTESDDWASILMRMYLRFADKLKFKTEIIDILDGEEAGIKSCTIKVSGIDAYGWLKTESGVHRLVRISPFNAAGKRMTSFASIWIYPEVSDDINIVLEDKDLKIDTFRASGAGGQHVNTTDSAVRITHIPTGTVTQSQSQRSQHKNKAEAISMMKAKLYQQELLKKEQAANAQNSTKTEIGWGHQIRSYVLQPYQMVKDLRTDFSSTDATKVLDGGLEGFVKASLSQKVTNVRQ
jgi:peptide chain release factor 2